MAKEKAKARGRPQKTLGQMVEGMKLMLPLLKGMDIEPALTNLLMTKVMLVKHEAEEPVRMVQGTEIVQISKAQMEEELKLHCAHGAEDEMGLRKALAECAARHSDKGKGKKKKKRSSRANFIATLLDDLREMLDDFTTEETGGGNRVDKQLITKAGAT